MQREMDNSNIMAPFNVEMSVRESLKGRRHSELEEKFRKETSETQRSQQQSTSCVPSCYMECLQCCGNQMGWMRILCPCLCACVKSPFYKQSNAGFGIVQNFGRYKDTLDPGYHFINPFTERVVQLSRQTQITECRQPVFTKDNITCTVSSVVYYRVVDAMATLYKLGLGQLRLAVQEMALAAIRVVCAQSLFQQLVQKRREFSSELLSNVNSQMHVWGVYVENIFMKDILIDQDLQMAMSLVIQTKRKAEASLIQAKGLVESARFISEAAKQLDTKAARQIRYLSTISEISQSDNPKILMVRLSCGE